MLNKYIFRNSYIKNSLLLTGGTILAQTIQLIFYPILTRLYLPSDFGVFATITSITTILSILASGGYENIILIADNKRTAVKLIWLTIIISLLSLSIVEVIFFISNDILIKLFENDSIKYWIYISPATAFFIIIYSTYNEWFVKNKYFVNLSLNKITNASTITISKTIFKISSFFNNGLILGEFIGRMITAFICISIAFKKDKFLFSLPNFNELKILAKKYIKAPKYILPSQSINSIGGQLPTIILAANFSIQDVGYFTMANSVLAIPASLISLAVRDTFKKQAFENFFQSGNSHELYKKTMFTMAAISLFGFSIFFLIAPELFSFVLGKSWRIAGEYARLLIPIVAVSFVSEIGSAMFIIADEMKKLLIWQLIYFSMTLFPILFGILVLKKFEYTLICFMIGRTITHILSIYMTNRIAKGK